MLIIAPIKKEIIEFLELFFMLSPVCNPITETNIDVPSFENVFKVLFVLAMISLTPVGPKRSIIKPVSIATNRTPEMPRETPFIRIRPIMNPATITKNKRSNGEISLIREAIFITKKIHM